MKKKSVILGAALVSILVITWFFSSPYLALKSLRDTALEGDRSELAERVDFPAVRDSLKAQINTAMMAELSKDKETQGLAALGAMFAVGIVNQMVDGFVTPDGIKAMVQQGRLVKPGDVSPAQSTGQVNDLEWSIEHDGLSKFKAIPTRTDGKKPPIFHFRRDGLGWKLIDIQLPSDTFAKANLPAASE